MSEIKSTFTKFKNTHTAKTQGHIETIFELEKFRDHFDTELAGKVCEKISEAIVDAFLDRHLAELVASIKLEDIKQLALIKTANKFNVIYSETVNGK